MTIAITGGKGGTGKSMVATSLAVLFARKQKTLLVDADAECPNDHLLLSVKLKRVSTVSQLIPVWNLKKCVKCGSCAAACRKSAVVFVKNRFPAFVKDACIGCGACISACPQGAITADTKEIGRINAGQNYNVNLISAELKLGELASGEVVSEVRKYAAEAGARLGADIVLIDSAAGIGCPVIASLAGSDYVVAVTEPTPSALHDLKRVLYLADHFKIRHGIIINKFDLAGNFCRKIEMFARKSDIPVIGKIPYSQDFIDSTIKMKPASEINLHYQKLFLAIIERIKA